MFQGILNLDQKSQNVLCDKHKESICCLNISENINLGDRLKCKFCNTVGQSILFFPLVEKYLYQWYQGDQEIINDELQKIKSYVDDLQQKLNEIQKLYSQLIKQIQQKMKKYQETFNQLLQEQSQTTLSQIIQNIKSSDNLNSQILQEIALFMSNQNIVDDQIEAKEKLQLSMNHYIEIEEQIKQLLNFLLDFSLNKLNQQQKNEQLEYITFKYKNPFTLEGHQANVEAVAISNDEKLIASADEKGFILLRDFPDGSLVQTYRNVASICDLLFSSDNNLLAAAQSSQPFNILIFNLEDIQNTKPQFTLQGHSGSIYRITFNSQSNVLISGSADTSLRIWNIQEQQMQNYHDLDEYVYGVNISQNEQFISASCRSGQVYLFNSSDLTDIVLSAQWMAHDDYTQGTTFTPDSQMLLTCYKDIRLWSIKQLLSDELEKVPLKVFKICNTDELWTISIRMSGQILISKNAKKIFIWKMENGQLLQAIDCQVENVYLANKNFSVSVDMKYIVTCGQSKILKIHELEQI